MAAGDRLTEQQRQQILDLHEQGKGRNAIARELGVGAATVTAIIQARGRTFERSPETVAATEAKRLDARAKRAALAEKLLDDAEKLRASLWEKCKIYNFGGKENTYAEKEVEEPPFRDKRDIVLSVKALLDTAVRLDEYDSGTGLPAAVSLLERIADGLTAKHGTGDDEFPDKPADGTDG